ncbi:MAG: hypothetical protein L3I99_07605 [Sulfurimonas sp.]|nr:hypothetical protein [Sulfurimonas sp.]
MKKTKSLLINGLLVGAIGIIMSGCTSLQESFTSQMEVPTLEKQVNRVAIGMTILRQNNMMAFEMPISADASWPKAISSELEDTQKQRIANKLQKDPYYATSHYTDFLQRRLLGSSVAMSKFGDYGHFAAMLMNQTISPLSYRVIQRTEAFYGKNSKNWPDIFNYNGSLNNFLEFKDGSIVDIEAISGDVYQNLSEAMISLTPVGMQKDLMLAQNDMLDAYDEVATLKSQKAQNESRLKMDEAQVKTKEEKVYYKFLTNRKKLQIKQELFTLDEQIKQAESIANEKEMIYYILLDNAIIAIKNEINIDDKNYVNLANNINIVSKEIQSGAIEAYASFALALTNTIQNDIIMKFPTELKSLAIAKMYVPSNLQRKYNKRIFRLVKNAVYFLPNIFMGTYYASKQIHLAQKYKDITEVILLAHELKMTNKD